MRPVGRVWSRLAGLSLLGLSVSAPAPAEVGEASARLTVFNEPSRVSELTVLNPAAKVRIDAADWLAFSVRYEADIVTGASESIKAGALTGVDVVSSATSFTDVRHVPGAGFTITREQTSLSASYAYGVESDYRSHSFTVAAGTDFLQRNTQLELSYGRGFDQVCTSAFDDTIAPTTRVALDSAEGCFSSADDRATRDIAIDNFQAAWTQNWTPVFNTQLVLFAGLQHGFLGNPYRSVVIAPAGDIALEHHPEDRARAALALNGRYFVREWRTAFSLNARLYRDTWDIWSQTLGAAADHYLASWLRLNGRLRFYNQSAALFWSDDYTGGEPVSGPRGQYWSGDRELSPLRSYALGAGLLATEQGADGARWGGLFTQIQFGGALDLVKTDLRDFSWGGVSPDDTLAIIATVNASGEF